MKAPLFFVLLSLCCLNIGLAEEAPWERHTIDPLDADLGKRGADGVRLGFFNDDQLPDVTTGWEQGGAVRVAVHPGPEKTGEPWPAITVGNVPGVEDAVFADLDADGNLDVVSCAEGNVSQVFIHWHPGPDQAMDASAWKTEAFPATAQRRWMFALPLDVNLDGNLDVVIGAKNKGAIMGWLEHPGPEQAREVASWKLHSMTDAGWIMSLRAVDLDADGDQDILFSDRYESRRGVYWVENPGVDSGKQRSEWQRQLIGGAGRHVMFLTAGDLNADGRDDIACATLEGDLLLYLAGEDGWTERIEPLPFGLTAGKGIAIADINLDGRADIVTTSEAQREADDMVSVSWKEQTADGQWIDHRISDGRGRKFDRIEMIDLDEDGDLDLITCEEVHNLGVFWYENPHR